MRWLLIAYVIANVVLIAHRFATGAAMHSVDFDVLRNATQLENPYLEPYFVWSPVMVYPLQVLNVIDAEGWAALHVLALVPFGWPLGALVGISYPFWQDLLVGNIVVFVAVIAYTAVRGNRAGMVAFIVLAMLVPRPVMLPVLVWLLWREPWTRRPFLAIASVHLGLVALTGLGDEWVMRLVNLPEGISHPVNLLPSRWIGYAWWPVGLALAAYCTAKGRLGLASIFASPYLYPMYLLMLVLDLRHADVHRYLRPGSARSPVHRSRGSRAPALDDVLVAGSRWRG